MQIYYFFLDFSAFGAFFTNLDHKFIKKLTKKCCNFANENKKAIRCAAVFAALTHDKKADGKTVTIAVADALGKGYLKTVELAALRGACEAACGKESAAPIL